MNMHHLDKMADLDQARLAMAKLLPNLPQPRPIEQLDERGISLPKIGSDSTALPILEYPRSLLGSLGPLTDNLVPDSWKPAYCAHKLRLRRNAQLVRLYPLCQHAGPSEFGSADGVVAGALLLCLRPMPGLVRNALMKRALTQAWGAFLAAHGIVVRGEEAALLRCIEEDSRLAAALWRANPDLAEPLLEIAQGRSDLWSGTMLLELAQAGPWLRHVMAQAANNEVAALTALTLQPSASPAIQADWICRLRQPHLAYLAGRWTQHTWPPSRWQHLRDQLRATALSDRGSSWYHWLRDNEAEQIDAAVREENIEVLWLAELVHHSRNYGQELRRTMVARLQDSTADREARLVLRWLNGRPRPQH